MEAIRLRVEAEDRLRRTYIEWETKTICQFVAATVPIAKGKENGLLKQANDISITDDFEIEEGNVQTATSSTLKEPDHPYHPADPEWQAYTTAKAAEKNGEKSFERISRGLIPKG